MKRLLASLLLVGTLGFAGVALSEEPMPAPAAATTEAAPAADMAAMPAEAAPAPEAAPAAEAPKLDSGATAWMLTSTALVLFMTIPGLALFYGGMVRKKNVLATMMQSFAITAMITVLWMVVGYSIAFDTTGMEKGVVNFYSFFGSLSKAFLSGMGKDSMTGVIPESVFMTFQMTFAIITPALIAGAFADRMKFSAMMWFMGLWSLLVYAPIAHMVWSGDGGFMWDMG
ncbi:MAG: ammonia channel protein, partial [Gallionellaceae bacterium]|nr:ammonia channel protein [Gallionellaceae bacterium]